MLIGRHWRGELSPLSAFLVAGLLVALLAAAGFRLLTMAIFALKPSLRVTAAIELLWYGAIAVIGVWAVVGMWRSVTGRSLRDRLIARSLVVLLLLGSASQVPDMSKTATELFQVARGHDPLGPPASVRWAAGEILVDGPLSEGSAARFAAALAQHPGAATVVVRSIGGRLLEAAEIAEAIRDAGLKTHARDYCMSACTIVLVAGKQRSASFAAEIGFHQPTLDGYSDADNRMLVPEMKAALKGAGVAGGFVDKASSTPASSMWYPSHEEMLDAGFLNREDLHAQLLELAAMTREMGVRRIDKDLLLTGASAGGRTITYTYALRAAGDGKYGIARSSVVEAICSEAFLSKLIEAGATVRHVYSDRSNAVIADVRVFSCPSAKSAPRGHVGENPAEDEGGGG